MHTSSGNWQATASKKSIEGSAAGYYIVQLQDEENSYQHANYPALAVVTTNYHFPIFTHTWAKLTKNICSGEYFVNPGNRFSAPWASTDFL